MTWAKLDDGFWSNPKVVAAGNEAAGIYARALSYCCQHLTDGVISADVMRFLGKKRPVSRLVESGLVVETEAGFQIPDFLDFNPSRSDKDEERAEARERMRRVRANRRNGSGEHKPNVRAKFGAGSDTPSRPVPSVPTEHTQALPKVARKQVTEDEWDLASQVLAAFNEAAGSELTIEAHYTPIVGRIREKPALTIEHHRRIIAANFRKPWWEDRPTPRVIYGSAAQFEASIEKARGDRPRRDGLAERAARAAA
jgi:hypothetical protein